MGNSTFEIKRSSNKYKVILDGYNLEIVEQNWVPLIFIIEFEV